MLTLHWKTLAIKDLIQIGEYIAQDSADNAEKMLDTIEAKVTALTTYPEMGRAGRKRGTRELVVHENYIVIYRELGKKLEILRVKHVAQQWPKSR